MEYISLGAHLVSPRSGYTHHGIYVGNGEVIHYSGLANGLRAGPIRATSLERFSNGNEVRVREHANAKYTGEEAVRRAKLRLGEDRYDLHANNCEHFCTWVVTGNSHGAQAGRIENFIDIIVPSGIWSSLLNLRKEAKDGNLAGMASSVAGAAIKLGAFSAAVAYSPATIPIAAGLGAAKMLLGSRTKDNYIDKNVPVRAEFLLLVQATAINCLKKEFLLDQDISEDEMLELVFELERKYGLDYHMGYTNECHTFKDIVLAAQKIYSEPCEDVKKNVDEYISIMMAAVGNLSVASARPAAVANASPSPSNHDEQKFERLRKVLSRRSGLSIQSIKLDSSFAEDLGADSIEAVEIIMAIEDEFGIEISDEAAEKITTVRDAMKYLKTAC